VYYWLNYKENQDKINGKIEVVINSGEGKHNVNEAQKTIVS
jgi:hypothetical protein